MKVTIKITRNNGTTFSPVKTEKRKVAHLACLEAMREGYLKVTYQRGVHNDGTFKNRKDFMAAFNAWTEPDLIKHCTEGIWTP